MKRNPRDKPLLLRVGAWVVILSFLFLFAGLAFAQPITVRTGAELTAKAWPDGTVLNVLADERFLYVDKPIQLKPGAVVKVYLNGATAHARVADWLGAFTVHKGQRLHVIGGTINSTSTKKRAAVNEGGELILENVTITGGDGIFAPAGRTMIGGSTFQVRKYGLYAGDLSRGQTAEVYCVGTTFRTAAKDAIESACRIMGAGGDFRDCTFEAGTVGKESLQIRYANPDMPVTFIGCTVLHGMSARPLRENEAGTGDVAKIYEAWARKHTLQFSFTNGSIRGATQVEGNTRGTFTNIDFIGKDPSGGGTDYAIKTGWIFGTRGAATAYSCTFTGWKFAGDAGVKIIP